MITKTQIHQREDLANPRLERFFPHAYCSVCDAESEFVLDNIYNYNSTYITFLESGRCTKCNLISRQRVALTQVKKYAVPGTVVYLQEQVTESYQWAIQNLKHCTVIGSEYMPNNVLPNIRHEDVQNLTFDSNSIDIILSQDVFEHVADPWTGFKECFRVLRPGGRMFMTIPLSTNLGSKSIDRVQHGLPPEYHGNPLSDEGSFVYTNFGWDIIHRLEQIGFKVDLSTYQSAQVGWVSPIPLFELLKPVSSTQVFP